MTGLYAHLLPAAEPTLKQAWVRAVQAQEALSHYCRAENRDLDEHELGRLEEAQIATRDGLYAALARQGIDKPLADRAVIL